MVDKLFHRYRLQLRPLILAIDFSSTIGGSPCLGVILWLKEVFGKNNEINKFPVTECPEETRSRRMLRYLFDTTSTGELNFMGDRYEFWVYRQIKKRLKSGELYLSDSVHQRSLQQEIDSAHENGTLIEPLNVRALNTPIKDLLNDR